MKKLTVALLVLTIAWAIGCKKKEAEPEPPPAAAEPVPTPTPTAEVAKPSGPEIPDVPLTGSASENLVAVFEAGVNALKGAPDAATGAAVLNGMLEKYDVAELRAKSKAAKEAGQGAPPELLEKFAGLKQEYNDVSTKLGASDPAAFAAAAKAWAKAWGLN
jgi:hypothetical protein